MSQLVEVKVPDIGDFADVPVIDLFVKVGDTIKVDDAIVTLESDKATMDVPSDAAGVVKEVLVKLGDKVKEGVALIKVEASAAAQPLPAPRPPHWQPRRRLPLQHRWPSRCCQPRWRCRHRVRHARARRPVPAATRRRSAPRTSVSRP